MTRRASAFRQSDITRAGRGALKAGLPVRRVEIDELGKISIICDEDAPLSTDRSLPVPVAPPNGWRL